MKLQYIFSRKGDSKANEDICGYANHLAWVIDGATDVFQHKTFGKENEVYWYVNKLQNKLMHNNIQNMEPFEILTLFVKQLYEELSQTYNLKSVSSYILPTFAVAMIAVKNNTLSYYVIGDCSIAYLHNNSIHYIKDERIEKFSLFNKNKIKTYMNNLNESCPPLTLFQETRRKANSREGYPIGTIDGKGLKNGITGKIKLDKNDKIIIYSDGFTDFISKKPEVILNLFDKRTIEAEIEKMYGFLRDQQEYLANPRAKKIDDCSILLLEV